MERKNFHLTIGLIIIKNNKALLMRRCNTGYMDGMYALVSGHVEDGESLKKAIIRESKEEIGIDVLEDDLKYVCITRKGDNDNYINTFLFTDTFTGEPKIMEKDKCDDLKWFPVDKLPSNMIVADRRAIDNYFNGKYFDEYNF